MKKQTFRLASAFAAAALMAAAQATENGEASGQPGAIGSELTLPLLPGVYAAGFMVNYSASRITGNNGQALSLPLSIPGVPVALSADIKAKISSIGTAGRVVWITGERVLDGRLALSATLPYAERRSQVSIEPRGLEILPAPVQAAVRAGLQQRAVAQSGRASGQGDIELNSSIDWADDEGRIIAGLSLTAPTGVYNKANPVNIGVGKYWTVRPVVAYGRIWENGLEVASALTYSINTRNTDTNIRSGQYFTSDSNVLYRVNDAVRIGLHGYALVQTSSDTGPGVAADGNRIRVFGAGPVIAYLADGARWNADLKVIREFSSRNRTEGTAAWLRAQYKF